MEKVQIAVNGTLMRGLALNQNLTSVGAKFVRQDITSDCYRMWSINDSYPAMIQDSNGGNQIVLEIWELTSEALLSVLNSEPPGLSLGKVQLENGELILGVLGEPYICEGMQEITRWGGWLNYLSDQGLLSE